MIELYYNHIDMFMLFFLAFFLYFFKRYVHAWLCKRWISLVVNMS